MHSFIMPNATPFIYSLNMMMMMMKKAMRIMMQARMRMTLMMMTNNVLKRKTKMISLYLKKKMV